MKEAPTEIIDKLIIDSIIERPICFELDGRFFYLYQPSLGTSLMSARYLKEFKLDESIIQYNEDLEMIRLVHENKDAVVKVLALHSFKRRSDVLDEKLMYERECAFSKIELPALAVLLKAVIEWNTIHEKLQKHYKLDKEALQRKKISQFKDQDRSSVIFGGRSLYGHMIDYAAERYGWSFGYVVWGISLTNLHMLMSDSVTSVFLTKEERGKVNISTDRIYLNADDPQTKQQIKKLYGKKKK